MEECSIELSVDFRQTKLRWNAEDRNIQSETAFKSDRNVK
jgi:hypothetical protein